MITKLLEEAFEKIGRETGNETENGRAKYLEDIIKDDYKTSITAKSLVRYLKKETSPKPDVRNVLAEYLGYEDYEDFVTSNSELKVVKKNTKLTSNKVVVQPPKNRRVLLGALSLLVGSLVYVGVDNIEGDCMVWVNNHYERCECKGQALEFTLNETELEKFRKIEVCDTTTFIKKYEPVIWYDKYNNKMEYFTYYGRNPLNGRTLRPITKTIINNHVKPCDVIDKP